MGFLPPSTDRRLALQMAISTLYTELSTHNALLLDRPSAQATAELGDWRQTTLTRRNAVLTQIIFLEKEVKEIEEGGRKSRWWGNLEKWVLRCWWSCCGGSKDSTPILPFFLASGLSPLGTCFLGGPPTEVAPSWWCLFYTNRRTGALTLVHKRLLWSSTRI